MLTGNRKAQAIKEREEAKVWKEQLKFIERVREREQDRVDKKAVRRNNHR